MKTGLTGLVFGCLVSGALVGGVATAKTSSDSVFDLFDRGVMSIVATTNCGIADPAAFKAFTSDFKLVAEAVQSELMAMNPGRNYADIAMIVGFRVAQLELRAEAAIEANGCNAQQVKAMRELFDLKSRFAATPLESGTVAH